MELPNRVELERQFGKRIDKLSDRHRRELSELLGSPPDVSKVTPAFWRRAKKEMEAETAALLLLLFGVSAIEHVKAVGEDATPKVRGTINKRAETYGKKKADDLATKYAEGAKDSLKNRAKEWEGGATKKEVDEGLDKVLGKGRSEKLGVNGTTEAVTAGGETGVGITAGTSSLDQWINRPWMSRTGPCPICKPLHETTRKVWSKQYPEGPGENVHSHCVCIIRYRAESKADKKSRGKE